MVGKDKGKQGNVIAYIRELNTVFVGGLNTVRIEHRNQYGTNHIVYIGNSTYFGWSFREFNYFPT